jgi:hypothetical protein
MSDSDNPKGNGAATGTARQFQHPRTLGDHGREIYDDAQALAAAVQSATDGVQCYLAEQVERRPYRTLGMAAGIGYVLGGGLRPRLTAVLLAAATRLATALAARELGARLLPGADQHPFTTRDPEDTVGAAKERS